MFSHKEEHEDQNMVKIEVNLDDAQGEWLGYVMDQLLDAGANDVYFIPIFMKKNRPGVLLNVLCDMKLLPTVKKIIFKETTTLGLRYYPATVHRLERKFEKVDTPWGEISVKIGILEGEVVQVSPEYEDCKSIALQNKLPLKEVYRYIWRTFDQ